MSKQKQLEKECPDYQILYLWEGDISFKWNECKDKILTILKYKEHLIKFDNYTIESIELNKAKLFCQKYHYLGKSFPIAPKKNYGLFYNDILVGVSVFSNTGSIKAGNIIGENVLELSRFALCNFLPKNTASYFLSRVILQIKKDIPNLDGLISYSDNSIHVGTIYKATNWIELGETKGSYYYLTPHGEKIDRRKVYNHCCSFSISEFEYARRMDLKKVQTSSKTKFLYYFK